MLTHLNIYGLSLAGSVSAACFAEQGRVVTTIDADSHKIDLINAGKSPFPEPGLASDFALGSAALPAARRAGRARRRKNQRGEPGARGLRRAESHLSS